MSASQGKLGLALFDDVDLLYSGPVLDLDAMLRARKTVALRAALAVCEQTIGFDQWSSGDRDDTTVNDARHLLSALGLVGDVDVSMSSDEVRSTERCRRCRNPMRYPPSPGYRSHHARGLCSSCYGKARRNGTVDEWPTLDRGNTAAFVEEILQVEHLPAEHVAARLGVDPGAIARRLYRAHRPDLARRFARAHRRR